MSVWQLGNASVVYLRKKDTFLNLRVPIALATPTSSNLYTVLGVGASAAYWRGLPEGRVTGATNKKYKDVALHTHPVYPKIQTVKSWCAG
jgi:hypothetical protein